MISQWEEEKIKATKIQTSGPEIKECIMDAEKHAFFKGVIFSALVMVLIMF